MTTRTFSPSVARAVNPAALNGRSRKTLIVPSMSRIEGSATFDVARRSGVSLMCGIERTSPPRRETRTASCCVRPLRSPDCVSTVAR